MLVSHLCCPSWCVALFTCLFAGPTVEEAVALRANYASIIWLSFLGWVGCSMMLYGLAGARAGGGGRQGESAEAGVTLSLLLELMVKLCCKPLFAICEQQAFLSFFNCPKAGLHFHEDNERCVPCFWFLCFAFQNPPSPDKFPNVTSDAGS